MLCFKYNDEAYAKQNFQARYYSTDTGQKSDLRRGLRLKKRNYRCSDTNKSILVTTSLMIHLRRLNLCGLIEEGLEG